MEVLVATKNKITKAYKNKGEEGEKNDNIRPVRWLKYTFNNVCKRGKFLIVFLRKKFRIMMAKCHMVLFHYWQKNGTPNFLESDPTLLTIDT